jgi:hypothetical protein
MSFKRQIAPLRILEGKDLDRAMAGIGMRFAVTPALCPPIEDVLFFASQLGMERNDFRVLNVLCKWIDVHGARINVDRMTRLVEACAEHERTKAFWASVGQWQRGDRRFARLSALRAHHERVDLFSGTEFQIQRHGGEHPWFSGTALRVAAGTLRDRASDVATPERLAELHPVYRERVVQGPSYRADMWATLSMDASLVPAELARRTYGSFATAWEVRRDWDIVHGSAAAA